MRSEIFTRPADRPQNVELVDPVSRIWSFRSLFGEIHLLLDGLEQFQKQAVQALGPILTSGFVRDLPPIPPRFLSLTGHSV